MQVLDFGLGLFLMDLLLFNILHKYGAISPLVDWCALFIAEYLPYILALAAIIVIFRSKNWRFKMWTLLVLVFSLLLSYGFLNIIIHYAYGRPRPFTVLGFTPPFSETSSSFPSSHATFFFTIAYVMFLIRRKTGYWFLALAILNGFARVFVGVHWPFDIVGGALIALIGFFITLRIFPKNDFVESLSETQ